MRARPLLITKSKNIIGNQLSIHREKCNGEELFFVGICAGDEFVDEVDQVAVEGLGILYHDEMA